MSLQKPIKCFPSIEEAQLAAILLENHNISSKVVKSANNWSYTLYVSDEDQKSAEELIGHLGFNPVINNDLESDASSQTNTASDCPLADIREAMKSQKKSFMQKFSVLIISLIVFSGMGFLQGPPIHLLLLLLVLLVHESGHWVSMKLFGYKDVQMFFIPGFGAAVSGNETTPCAKQKAIISLMGPIPGIIIGIGCGVAYAITHNNNFSYLFAMFILINGFNLLPFSPLDGGRFLEAVLFTRHPRAEIAFKILAAAGLTLVAFQWKSFAIGLVVYFTFISLKRTWAIAKTVVCLRKDLPDTHNYIATDIPDHFLQAIVERLKDSLPPAQRTARHLAAVAKNAWSRIIIRHCSIRASIGLTLLYLFFTAPSLGLLIAGQIMATRHKEPVEQPVDRTVHNQTESTVTSNSIPIEWTPYKDSEYPWSTPDKKETP